MTILSGFSKKLLLIIFCIGNLISFAQHKKYPFVLNGFIDDPISKTAILSYQEFGKIVKQTTEINNKKFSFKGNITEPMFVSLIIDSSTVRFYIEKGIITVNIPSKDLNKFRLEGSKTERDRLLILTESSKLKSLISSLNDKLENLNQTITEGTDSVLVFRLKKQVDSTRNAISIASNKLQLAPIYSIKTEPNSFSVLTNLAPIIMMFHNSLFPLEKADSLYNIFSEELKNTPTGEKVRKLIENYKNIKRGGIAPDFSVYDIKGNKFTLSDFRGSKYVFIDAWASWCPYCIKSMPYIKELINKYKDVGIVIIGISRDSDKTKWIKAINKYGITEWYHVLAEENPYSWLTNTYTEQDILMKYPLINIPKYYLIDKEGIIIGNWDGYSEEIENEIKMIFNDISKK